MFDPAFAKALADLPWVALCIFGVSAFVVALFKGWLVPGIFHWPLVDEVKELRKALKDQTAAELERERRRRHSDG